MGRIPNYSKVCELEHAGDWLWGHLGDHLDIGEGLGDVFIREEVIAQGRTCACCAKSARCVICAVHSLEDVKNLAGAARQEFKTIAMPRVRTHNYKCPVLLYDRGLYPRLWIDIAHQDLLYHRITYRNITSSISL